MFRFVLIGAGQRGMIYAQYAYDSGLADIAAIAEPDEKRRLDAAEKLFVKPERCFESAQDMFAKGRMGDAAIIASMDKDHYAQAMRALELGYDLLLEKPISPDPLECMLIEERAKQTGRRVVVYACTSLVPPVVWAPLQTNTFAGTAIYFFDARWTNHPRRYYRLREE